MDSAIVMYPPILESKLTPIIRNVDQNNGVEYTINLPITYNRFNTIKQITGCRIHIVSTVTGKTIGYMQSTAFTNINTKEEINIPLTNLYKNETCSGDQVAAQDVLLIGNYYKIQAAFLYAIGANQTGISAYSTFGVSKVINKADFDLSIGGLDGTSTVINYARGRYTGQFEFKDKAEKVNKYKFRVEQNNELYYETDWLLHDNSTDTINTATNKLEGYDFFDIYLVLDDLENYTISYQVMTINNYIITSKSYRINNYYVIQPVLSCNLYAQQNELTNGIDIYMSNKTDNPAPVTGHFLLLRSEYKINTNKWSTPYEILKFDMYGEAPSEQTVELEYQVEDTDNTSANIARFIWKDRLLYSDYTTEQGITYKYHIQQYGTSTNENVFYYSDLINSNEIYSNFEDACLFDGQKQLIIKYNPKISSFKTTKIDGKQDTIGGKYPFIFRGANTNYKEFTIAGLISYTSDFDGCFDPSNKIIEQARAQTPTIEILNTSSYYDLTAENFAKERKFKLNVLDWLNDGQPKLFRSPGEGNYLVRLMNVSLTPNEQLGRMIHTFQCTAYEIAPVTIASLTDKKIFSQPQIRLEKMIWKQANLNSTKLVQNTTVHLAEGGDDITYFDVRIFHLSEGDHIKFYKTNQSTPWIDVVCGGHLYEYNFCINDAEQEKRRLAQATTQTEINNILESRISGHFEIEYGSSVEPRMIYTYKTPVEFDTIESISNVTYKSIAAGYVAPGTRGAAMKVLKTSGHITAQPRYPVIQWLKTAENKEYTVTKFYKMRFIANYLGDTDANDHTYYHTQQNNDYWVQINDERIDMYDAKIYELNNFANVNYLAIGPAVVLIWSGERVDVTYTEGG